MLAVPSDTPPPNPRPRAQAVEVSEWYNRRLTIHRWLSYTSYPLFAFQWAAGRQKWEKGDAAPEWAKSGHRAGAAAIAGVFTVNTITGVWNLVESRHIEDGRARRYLHGASMLIADAGFTWAGAVLSEQAKRSTEKGGRRKGSRRKGRPQETAAGGKSGTASEAGERRRGSVGRGG